MVTVDQFQRLKQRHSVASQNLIRLEERKRTIESKIEDLRIKLGISEEQMRDPISYLSELEEKLDSEYKKLSSELDEFESQVHSIMQ